MRRRNASGKQHQAAKKRKTATPIARSRRKNINTRLVSRLNVYFCLPTLFQKHKKEKKAKKEKKDKKKKRKRRERSSSESDASTDTEGSVKGEEKEEWVEMTKELREQEVQKMKEEEAQMIGPAIPEHLLEKSSANFDGKLDAK